MAWTTPRTWSTGELVTAANMNTHVRDQLRHLRGMDGVAVIENAMTVTVASAAGPTVTLQNTQVTADTAGVIQFLDSGGVARGQILAFDPSNGLRLFGGGPGRMVVWGDSAIAGTPITVVPSGVSRRYYITGIAYNVTDSAGQPINAGQVVGGSVDVYSNAGDILRVSSSAGALTIARAGGSDTYDAIMSIWYM